MTRSNTEIVRTISEQVWGEGKVELIDELYARDYVDRNPAPGLPGNREGLKMQVQGYRSAFPDMEAEVNEIIGCEDKVVVRYTISGTHRGDMMGVPPTGRRAKVSGVNIMHIENGKVVEEYSQTDMMGLYQQLGLLPEQGV